MATSKATPVLMASAPKIEPGVTYATDGKANLIVREVVYVGPDSAAVYLDQRFEIAEIRYFVTEPTKRKPDPKCEWRRVPRSGAPTLSIRTPK